MKLLLIGHTERYPVEQLQMQLFPDEPSEFVTHRFTGDGTVSSLSRGKKYLTATAKVTKGGKTGFASRRIPLENADVRMTRRILQQSYYLAATKVLGTVPPWGALSGVRPTKLSTKCMLEGGSEKDAANLLEKTYFVTPERSRLCVDASKHTLEAAKLLEPGDLSVYIGIPFCPTRCSYCSFVSESIERFGAFLPPYLEALHREIAYTGKLLADSGYHIRSLYMGGGTPTTLSSAQMKDLLRAIKDSFDLSRCLEFTVEGGRPDTLDEEKLRVIHDGGATRISINPQTMADDVLAAVGRKHTAAQTVEAFRQARAVGFEDINMDLIAGLPEDTPEKFAALAVAGAGSKPQQRHGPYAGAQKGRESVPEPDGRFLQMRMSLRCSPARKRRFGRIVLYHTISTGRNTCPAALKIPAGAARDLRAGTTYT